MKFARERVIFKLARAQDFRRGPAERLRTTLGSPPKNLETVGSSTPASARARRSCSSTEPDAAETAWSCNPRVTALQSSSSVVKPTVRFPVSHSCTSRMNPAVRPRSRPALHKRQHRLAALGLPVLFMGGGQSRGLRCPVSPAKHHDRQVSFSDPGKASLLRRTCRGTKVLGADDPVAEALNRASRCFPIRLETGDDRTDEDLHS